MNPLILLGGSLVAILTLAGVAWLLKLGGGTIADEAQAMADAEAILSGFDAERAVLAEDHKAALVHGRDGSVALLKIHGSQVAGRRLSSRAPTRARGSRPSRWPRPTGTPCVSTILTTSQRSRAR